MNVNRYNIKRKLPIVVTLSGIVTNVKPLQPKNAELPSRSQVNFRSRWNSYKFSVPCIYYVNDASSILYENFSFHNFFGGHRDENFISSNRVGRKHPNTSSYVELRSFNSRMIGGPPHFICTILNELLIPKSKVFRT